MSLQPCLWAGQLTTVSRAGTCPHELWRDVGVEICSDAYSRGLALVSLLRIAEQGWFIRRSSPSVNSGKRFTAWRRHEVLADQAARYHHHHARPDSRCPDVDRRRYGRRHGAGQVGTMTNVCSCNPDRPAVTPARIYVIMASACVSLLASHYLGEWWRCWPFGFR